MDKRLQLAGLLLGATLLATACGGSGGKDEDVAASGPAGASQDQPGDGQAAKPAPAGATDAQPIEARPVVVFVHASH